MPTLSQESRDMLMELADFLTELPPERFNYRHWVGSDWKGDPAISCGTTACAAGWATTLPSFQHRGLFLRDIGPSSPYWDESGRRGVVAVADAEGWDGFLTEDEAMAKALDIPIQDARFLFWPGQEWVGPNGEYFVAPYSLAGPLEVASHIRRYIELVD